MFSSITEAWDNDPVREMTSKLTNGNFRTQSEHADVFRFKNESNRLNDEKCRGQGTGKAQPALWGQGTGKAQPALWGQGTGKAQDSETSISLLSGSDYSTYAPVDFGKKKYKQHHHSESTGSSDSDSPSFFAPANSKCAYSIKHLKKCRHCNDQLKKLINREISKKFDEIILDTKMKQIQSINQPIPSPTGLSDSWKEILIIMVGAVVAIFILFLTAKSLNR